MKKILLMLALMLPCLGAWAEIQPSTNTDVPEKLYKIKSKKNIYMAAHANPTQNNYGRFAFYAVDGKDNTYKIYSYDANLWLSYTKKAGYSDAMNFVSFAQTQEDANEWCVTEATNGYYQVAPYNTTSVAGRYWNFFGGINSTYYSYDDYRNTLGLYYKNADNDEGSAWTLEAVAADDYTAPTTLNYELTDGDDNVYSGTYTGVAGRTRLFTSQNTRFPITYVTWEGNTYKANIASPFPISGVVISTFNTDNIIRLSAKEGKEIATKTVPTVETINDYLWDICPSVTNNTLTFSIKHVATNKFIHTTATTHDHADETVTLEDEGTQFVYVANNGFKYGNLWLSTNSRNSDEQCLGMWNSQHDGAKHLIHKVNNFAITDAAGNVHEGEFNGYGLKNEAFLPAFTGVEGYTLSNQSWSGNTFNATITFPFIVSSASQSNPMLIRQHFNVDNKMWTAVGEDVNAVDGVPSLGTSQWMIYPSLNGTEFTFKIKSVSTEKYVTATTEDVTLTTEGTNFKCGRTTSDDKSAFVWTCTNGDETLYVTLGSDEDNTPLGVTTNVATAGVKAFVDFQDFKEFKVTIGNARYTTVYSPFTALMLNPVEIYAITNKEVVNDKVQLTQMSWYIPREQAAILKGEPGTYVFAKTDDNLDAETDAVWEQNLLEGSSVNTYIEGEAYVLGNKSKGVALYLAYLDKDANGGTGTTHFLNNAGKAYLPADPSMTSLALSFNFGGNTTAIESVLNNSTDANAPIYDLTGRRVMNTVKGGIYIQNGKKFIVK